MRRKYRERPQSTVNEETQESMCNFCCLTLKNSVLMINNELFIGVPPSQKDNMKSYLLDNADPIDRTYHSYTTNNAPQPERQIPNVSTRPDSTWEPPRNIFSDL